MAHKSPDTKKVLIVDDDDDTRVVYSTMLKYEGYDVTVVGTGEAGLQAADKSPPLLVVLDVSLPGMSGWEVCLRLKQNPATADVKVLMVTAHAFIGEGDRAKECGADGLLTKPASPLLLRDEISNLIGPATTSPLS